MTILGAAPRWVSQWLINYRLQAFVALDGAKLKVVSFHQWRVTCDVRDGGFVYRLHYRCTQTTTIYLLRHVRIAESEPYYHSILFVCLSGCVSVIPRPTAYHDWSITTKFGRQVYTCPRTRVSLFGSPVSHTLGARGKNMQNFAYFQRVFLPLRMWRIVPYDLSLFVP